MPQLMKLQTLLVLCCMGLLLVKGYRTGADPKSCLDFKPHHKNSTPQPSTPPYRLKVDVNEVASGETIVVTLIAEESDSFEGFLVQARCTRCTTSDTEIVPGIFAKMYPDDPSKSMTCDGGTDNSMTHTDASPKETISFAWTAPDVPDLKAIKFRASVVQSYTNWWIGVESQEIIYIPKSRLRFYQQHFWNFYWRPYWQPL